ncbi:AraC family transcriptional regulator [Granulicella sp. WH15]|uniref:helix-turn-helix domain-containing protein n=1 Tax=Granulicella sp. WH15 TaxID=2602070 RepID=UPI001C707E4E|nr:AraC family transcriptional regulator [Granulicella sp. WH15]
MIFVTPGTRDSVIWHGVSQRIVASIHPSLLARAAKEMELKGSYDFENCWSFKDRQLQLLLTEMDREMNSDWAMGALYGDLLGMCLSSTIIKKYGRSSSLPVLLKGGLSRSHLKQVLSYIEANLHRDLCLQELSGLIGLSMFHFARSFRDSAGVTPHQYVVQMRVERAKTLLMRRELSVQQVASATGFADGSQLSKSFRKAMGVSPSQWRRML